MKTRGHLLVPITCVAARRLGKVSPAYLMEPGSLWVGGVGTGDNWGFVQGCRVAPRGRKINVWFLALERRKQDAVDLLQPVQSVNVFFLSDAAVTYVILLPKGREWTNEVGERATYCRALCCENQCTKCTIFHFLVLQCLFIYMIREGVGGEATVVQELYLSRPGESACSDEEALCIQCLKLALKIAHSTS